MLLCYSVSKYLVHTKHFAPMRSDISARTNNWRKTPLLWQIITETLSTWERISLLNLKIPPKVSRGFWQNVNFERNWKLDRQILNLYHNFLNKKIKLFVRPCIRGFHKLDEIGNNANIDIRDFTTWKQKNSVIKCYP